MLSVAVIPPERMFAHTSTVAEDPLGITAVGIENVLLVADTVG
jgi:hypothetical protein